MSAGLPNRVQPMSWMMGVIVVLTAIAIPLVPAQFRPWNFAAFGAVGLFIAARSNFWRASLMMIGCKMASDIINYLLIYQGNTDYQSIGYVLACLMLYPLLGQTLRNTQNPFRIGGITLGGSLAFFILTNFGAWLRQDVAYGYTPGGLLECYINAVPFLHGTVLGDLAFTVVFFVTHALLVESRVSRADGIAITIPVDRS